MDLRYVRRYQDILKRQREDVNNLEIAHEWAKKKATISKEMQNKLENMKFKADFSFSKEAPPPEERIAPQD